MKTTQRCLLALDIGSSSAKVGLVAESGEVLAVGRYPYATAEPMPGYKEQEPEDWWKAVVDGIRHAFTAVPSASVVAVGVAGYISSLTFLDEQGRPVRKAIGFQDRRASAQVAELTSSFSSKEFAELLGIDLPPASTWPLPKLLWMKQHEPKVLERSRYLLQAKDFVNFKLTGIFGSDPSSNRGLADLGSGRVPYKILSKFGLPDLLPPLLQPEEVLGTVTPAAAQETGLPPGVPVVVGWNDLNASVLGSGLVSSGQAFDVTGTSEHIGVVTDRDLTSEHLICAPFLPGRRLFYGVTSCGGGSLQWFRRLVGQPMEAAADSMSSPDDDLLFLPYLEGERSPIWDPDASGVLLGLRSTHGADDVGRAVLEGVAFSLRQIWESIEAHAPLRTNTLVASGGASTSETWNQIKADVLNKRIASLQNPHAGIQGAAILAAVAIGIYPDPETASQAMCSTISSFSPSTDDRGHIDRMFALYKGVYPALRNTLHSLSAETKSRMQSGGIMPTKNAVVFGAGKIARGFIAHLLTISGYHVTFVEKNMDLVQALRKQGKYTVEIMGAPEKNITISDFDVLQSDDVEQISQAIEQASVIFVSIGGPNLPQIAPLLARGLEKRSAGINIILGENYFQPAQWLRQLIGQHIAPSRLHWFETRVGIVETMILRSTIEPTEEMRTRNPLSLKAQNAWEIPADKEAFVGGIPPIQGLAPRNNFQGGLIRKLFTYNCINAVVAYTGNLKGYTLLSEAANDAEIVALARAAYEESGQALCKQFGFDPEEQREFAEAAIRKYQDRQIVDPIERNARDPLRKLSRNDRLIGPACLAIAYGKTPVALSRAIAAAFLYGNPNDPASVALQRTVAEKGLPTAIGEISGIDPAGELTGLIVASYKELANRVVVEVPAHRV